MAVRISTSKFLESTVAKQAAVEVANTVLPDQGGPLPVGIKGGVAKLTEIYFENDEKYGEGFRAEAEIELPVAHSGQYIKGKKTRQWITFNAENLAERITRVGLVLKALGGDGIIGDGRNVNFIKIVEFLQTATKRAPIYFGFSTSAKDSGEWPWENWHKAIPGFVPPSATPVAAPMTPASDQKKTEPNVNGPTIQEIRYTQGGVTTPHSIQSGGYQSVAVPDAGANTYSDTEDIDSLIFRAGNKDEVAMDKLDEYAKALAYTQLDLDNADSYEVIGGWVKGGKVKDAEVKVDRVITINQVYNYTPLDKRGVNRIKSEDCRVVAIDNIRNTVQLQGLVSKKIYETTVGDEFIK